MTRRKKPTPMRQAIDELYEIQSGSGLATPQQLMDTAIKYDVEVWILESAYLDEVEWNIEADSFDRAD